MRAVREALAKRRVWGPRVRELARMMRRFVGQTGFVLLGGVLLEGQRVG